MKTENYYNKEIKKKQKEIDRKKKAQLKEPIHSSSDSSDDDDIFGVEEIKGTETMPGELTQEEKDQVVASYRKNKPDTKFKVTYEVDPSILGGLQMFAGTSFLDCSLRSRIEKLKT